jgi:hypothetical protein
MASILAARLNGPAPTIVLQPDLPNAQRTYYRSTKMFGYAAQVGNTRRHRIGHNWGSGQPRAASIR